MVLIHNQVSLFYEVHGEGKPIVLLHGNGEDHHTFAPILPYLLQAKRQVILMDMRGHGESAHGNEPLSFSLFAKDVIALFDHLHLKCVDLLGFSDGANTAMEIALLAPERIDHLILNAGNLTPWGMKFQVWMEVLLAYGRETDAKRKELLSLMVKQPHIKLIQCERIPCTTLVITGENDMIRASHTRKIVKAIEDCEAVILPGCDHFAVAKEPQRFFEAIEHFLKKEGSTWKNN